MAERKLATIEQVVAIHPIPDADAIEAAVIRGWTVVMKKGEVAAGDLVVYFEIDSALPLDRPEFAFLAPRGEKIIEVDGVQRRVHVLKTAKLRGQVSQGLALPLNAVGDTVIGFLVDTDEIASTDPDPRLESFVGIDMSEAFGVVKYDPPIPAELSGAVVGPFPTRLLPKTDAERVQNLADAYPVLAADPEGWYATEKVDGSSVTILNDGTPRLCSRNWELVWNPDLTQVKAAEQAGLVPEPGWAIQAEVYGEGIQSNPLKITGQKLAVYNVLRQSVTGNFAPVPRDEWPERFAAASVPVLDLELPATIEEAVTQVDGLKSAIGRDRLAEGVVWHHRQGKVFSELDGRECFKAISNKYLLKHGG